MIVLTRLDKQTFFVNPDHIVSLEETPDTVITLFNGHHFIVRESARIIIDKIVAFRSRIIRRARSVTGKTLRSSRKREFFRSATLNRDGFYQDNHKRLPLHSRDF